MPHNDTAQIMLYLIPLKQHGFTICNIPHPNTNSIWEHIIPGEIVLAYRSISTIQQLCITYQKIYSTSPLIHEMDKISEPLCVSYLPNTSEIFGRYIASSQNNKTLTLSIGFVCGHTDKIENFIERYINILNNIVNIVNSEKWSPMFNELKQMLQSNTGPTILEL